MASKSIMVVGGGISGITTALEAAEAGYQVYLVEKNPYLGGKVAQINEYFPKLCPPNCGLEINYRRIRSNKNLKLFTLAEVESISGQEGNFDVTVRINPGFVNNNCTGCGKCAEVCPVDRPNAFNFGLDQTKSAYLPNQFAFPFKYTIDPATCTGAECGKCAGVCEYQAIDLNMQQEAISLNVGAIVWATGWNSYDVTKLSNYGAGQFQNVISNIKMERMVSPTGPTQGKIIRPSDGKEVNSVAFVQCAGSRDENHIHACSYVCCLASLKQATYVREQYPDAKITIFYIDIRARGRNEDFYVKVMNETNVNLVKGKVGEILEDPATNNLTLLAEDQEAQALVNEQFDLVVLASGMHPATATEKIPADMSYDVDGFVVYSPQTPGIYATGCSKKPMDVASSAQDATATALKAIQSTVRGQK